MKFYSTFLKLNYCLGEIDTKLNMIDGNIGIFGTCDLITIRTCLFVNSIGL